MPKKSRLENILFTLVMAFIMVYAMVCYNIANKGGMTNEVFLLAFHEIRLCGRSHVSWVFCSGEANDAGISSGKSERRQAGLCDTCNLNFL